MEQFKIYFMGMSVQKREKFAAGCGTSRQHLTNIAYGKKCGEALAISIERESRGAVRCEDLRNDVDWAFIRGTKKQSYVVTHHPGEDQRIGEPERRTPHCGGRRGTDHPTSEIKDTSHGST